MFAKTAPPDAIESDKQKRKSCKKINGKPNASHLKPCIPTRLKSLITTGKTGKHYVFVIPVAKELDLKKAAKCVNEKSIEMLKQKDLLPLTGYIHGGCSPIGMKKFFTITIDYTAENFDTIIFSGGRVGLQLEMSFSNLCKAIRLSTAELTV